MDDATKQALLSAVRSFLIVIGGIAVTHGYLSSEVLNEVVGSFIVLAGAAWGVIDKLTKKEPS